MGSLKGYFFKITTEISFCAAPVPVQPQRLQDDPKIRGGVSAERRGLAVSQLNVSVELKEKDAEESREQQR